jgi:hypothetical protein
VSASNILPLRNDCPRTRKGKERSANVGDEITVTLNHDFHLTVWHLSINTTTRTLYCLANRATKGRYSRFTLRLATSKVPINDSAALSLGLTDLSHGGTVEICLAVFHTRRLSEVSVKYDADSGSQKVLLPSDAPILALLSYLEQSKFGCMSDIRLWHVIHVLNALLHHNQFTHVCRHGLRQTGDGNQVGNIVDNGHTIFRYASADFECLPWSWQSVGAHRERESSRYLSRLDLLKELFNVFLNRAVSNFHNYSHKQLNFSLLHAGLF